MKRRYETKIYKDPTKLLIVLIFTILITIAAIIYLAKVYDLKQLGFVVALVVLILPFCFSGMIKRRFMKRNAILDFDAMTFGVTLRSLDTDTIMSQESFLWTEIEAYRVYFDTKANTCLTLYLRDKRTRAFIFNDNKTFEEAVAQNSVFSNFYFFVKYLSQHGQKIKVKPSILATRAGQTIISVEIALIIFALILHLITHSISKSYYLLFAIVLVIPQVVNRVQNKALLDKMLELDR